MLPLKRISSFTEKQQKKIVNAATNDEAEAATRQNGLLTLILLMNKLGLLNKNRLDKLELLNSISRADSAKQKRNVNKQSTKHLQYV